jgi:hypothetical protein
MQHVTINIKCTVDGEFYFYFQKAERMQISLSEPHTPLGIVVGRGKPMYSEGNLS